LGKETCGLGTYLYCVTNYSSEGGSLSYPGIDGQPVHSVSFREISGIVHRCSAEPYDTRDDEIARKWVLSHQNIVDLAMNRFGTVVPLKFNTIFKGGDDEVTGWLNEEHDRLVDLLERFRNKAEYSIRINIDESSLGGLVNKHPEVSELEKALENKPKGASYLLQKKLDQSIRVFREVEARAIAEELYRKIAVFSEEVHHEAYFSFEDKSPTILKVSCLVKEENVKPLGKLLSSFIEEDGLDVKFTGPWPPYSFVYCENGKRVGK
jgi:hypothetical protein